MAIRFVIGKPGSGKSRLGMERIIRELRLGSRMILTNMPVRIEPWVNGAGEAMLGLRNYIAKKYGTDYDLMQRLFIVDDETMQFFYRLRPILNGDGGYHLTPCFNEESLTYESEKLKQGKPMFVVADECHRYWPSREWAKMPKGMLVYTSQHRHFGDDILMLTQSTKQVDAMLVRIAQDFLLCRDRRKLKVGKFRQPGQLQVSVFERPPAQGMKETPMATVNYPIDAGGICQCYDTSAGVGIAGGMAADIEQKPEGLPFWVLVVSIIVGLIAVYFSIRFAVSYGTGRVAKGVNQVAASIQPKIAPAGAPQPLRPQVDGTATKEKPLRCVGFVGFPEPKAFFSDGRVITRRNGLLAVQDGVIATTFGTFNLNNYDVPEKISPPRYRPAVELLKTPGEY